jgi:heat shock protein HslJ
VECPPVEIVNGVPVIPDGAPAECVYIQTVDAEDPCAPDATGEVPVMCQSGLPVDPPVGGDACWVTSDGSTNCPRTGGEIAPTLGRHFALVAVSLSGVRYEVAAGQMYFGDDGSFSATVGCNQLAGSVTTNSDGTYTVADLLSTKMYCEELSAAETTFSEILLGGALTFSRTDTGLVAQNSVGTLELIEAMYDAVPANGEERATIGGDVRSSELSALLIAIALLGIPALVGAAGLSLGLSRRD